LEEGVFFPYRHARLTERLSPHLQDVTSVLDVGASCGRLARRLADATGCQMVGIDVCLQPRSYIEVRRYDGRTFPFTDGVFDCVMMVDMLHHTGDIERMMCEACRVSRRYVLIKDHYWDTPLDLAGLRVADYLGNAPYGIPLPYNFLRLEEWVSLFHRHGLRIVSWGAWKLHPLDPCKHIVVKLRKT
jgi:SAM-dependent methyltransferase